MTLGSSVPSLPVAAVDVPEISRFTATFTYNRFTPDELTTPGKRVTSPFGTVEFSRTVPRFITLNWNKVHVSSTGKLNKPMLDIQLKDYPNSIVDEELLSLKNYSYFQQQETELVAQTQVYLDKLYKQLNYNTTNASLSDAIRALHESTPEGVSGEFLSKYLSVALSKTLKMQRRDNTATNSIEQLTTVAPVSHKVFGTVLHEKLLNDTLTPIDKGLTSGLQGTFDTQASVRQYSNRLNGSQYDLTLADPVVVSTTEQTVDTGLVYQSTGYTIDRYRVASTGGLVDKTTFYVELPDTVEFIDTEVVYGQRYVYDIRVVTAIQTMSFSAEEKVNVTATYLVASKPVRQSIETVDNTPAEPPTDFFVRWDYGSRKPVLTWNYPIDPRRHIKYFQVFRRKNVGRQRPVQQPFELVRMYDVNDLQNGEGTYYSNNGELFSFVQGEGSIDSSLVVKVSSTRNTEVFTPTSYVDEEFNPEDYYIYAVAAVDAHGITTNLSNQIGVKFNGQRNTIDRVDISQPNAPKPYPNLYINRDTFIDTMKTEGYSQVTVVFNPEYLTLHNASGDNTNLLAMGPDNFYRLQLINTDLQEDAMVDIKITDNRTNPTR